MLEIRTQAKSAGKVTHDPRGTAVWNWAIETGVLAKATVAELLNRLVEPAPIALVLEDDASSRFSGDPYNRSGV